jgi:hypothetical protein
MARGNRRERIFRNEADRLLFYQTLGEACVLPLLLSAPHRKSVAFSFKISNLSLKSFAQPFSVF